MTQDQMKQVMVRVFAECQTLRDAGQKEYAGGEESFGNFNRLAGLLGINRKAVLMVYFTKHFDGIMSYVRGHRSQREDVRGRINDAIVYLCLLRGMVEEEEANVQKDVQAMLPDNGRGDRLATTLGGGMPDHAESAKGYQGRDD